MNVFRSAITETDGKTVNVGYLVLFWVLVMVLGILPFLLAAAFLQQWHHPQSVFPFADLKDGLIGVAALLTGALGALGVYLFGEAQKDKVSVQQTGSEGARS